MPGIVDAMGAGISAAQDTYKGGSEIAENIFKGLLGGGSKSDEKSLNSKSVESAQESGKGLSEQSKSDVQVIVSNLSKGGSISSSNSSENTNSNASLPTVKSNSRDL